MANGFEARQRTMGELATELRARLGFVTQGTAAQANDQKIKSFLQEAHEYVYAQLEPPPRRKTALMVLAPGQRLYDWHNDADDEDINPGRVLAVWLRMSAGVSFALVQGISEAERSGIPQASWPTRYDTFNGQLEVWPVSDAACTLAVDYTAGLGRFDQPGDRPGVPDRLVALYALATAKADLRMPDAPATAAAFQALLSKEKMGQLENRRYFAAGALETCTARSVIKLADGRYAWRP
jgi:hypothetical protein